MRTEFIQELTELAKKDKRIFLITGDLGYNVIEDFIRSCPDQFVNAGVSEQNMTGTAAGLALSGKIVFTYSIANFPTIRALEQVRNDICYHNANVKIIAVGAGFTYGPLGSSHHGTEDLTILRALPHMTIVAPADAMEAREAAKAVVRHEGPVYIRISKSDPVYQKPVTFQLGKAITIKEGKDVALIAIGSMVADALKAGEELKKKNVSARVISMHTLKPLDVKAILKAAKETKAIITIEEHTIIGGLGGAVAEVLAENKIGIPFVRMGVPDTFSTYIGDQNYLKKKYGLTADNIMRQAFAIIK